MIRRETNSENKTKQPRQRTNDDEDGALRFMQFVIGEQCQQQLNNQNDLNIEYICRELAIR